jgi:7-cyano-7-deazaguanine synthase
MTSDGVNPESGAIAVLVSGGLDSAVLLRFSFIGSTPHAFVDERKRPTREADVYPLYLRCGLTWEDVELRYLERLLAAIACPTLKPLHILEMPTRDLYDLGHWSVSGQGVPGADTPDEAVFLPGRNVLLLSKAMLWCHLHGVSTLGLAPLGSNPFPDATPEFFHDYAKVVNQSVGGSVRLWLPFAHEHKVHVMQLGQGLDMPWHLTFSCIRPRGDLHCGACNKCAERQNAFRDAGIPDPTRYARDARSSS